MSTLSWELHGPGSEIFFQANSADLGYGITLSRDGVKLINENGLDGSAMLQRAQELRRWFLQLGYSAQVREEDASLMGGPCWGPGAPLPIPVMPSPSREHLRIAA